MKRSEKFSDIRKIADDVCSNSVTEEQLQQLEQKLRGNPEAKRFYFDYIRVHDGLKSAADRNMEVVYRRMTEEVVIRPKSDANSGHGKLIQGSINADSESPSSLSSTKLLIIFSFVLLSLALLIWLLFDRNSPSFLAQIEQGQVSIAGQGQIDFDRLYSGQYYIQKDTILKLNNGDIFSLSAGSKIKLFTESEVKLLDGTLDIKPVSAKSIFVHSSNFRLMTNGGALSVDLTHKQPVITTGDNTILHALRWQPQHYWSFEGEGDRVINSASSAHGIIGSGATRVKGLLGEGAFHFNNSASARIEVGTGGGTAPATGSFSAMDGLTIEALISPEYSGKLGDNDEIFHKGHLDGKLRVTLGFRTDEHTDNHLKSETSQTQESLAFGLYLVGQGYHELKLPLDGQDGRPTLAEMNNGNVYHIVASYDVDTGLKAIYLNGQLLASHQYPPGSKMLSGGPGDAAIGNNPTEGLREKFAFSGTIDEVAFYDFALPPYMISQHLEQVQQGVNYFRRRPSNEPLKQHVKIVLPVNTTLAIDSLTGLPEKIVTK